MRNYSLTEINKLLKGTDYTSNERREALLCLTALFNKKIKIGDVIRLDTNIYIVGIKGLYDYSMQLEKYRDIGFEYLEECAVKVNYKQFEEISLEGFPGDFIADEYYELRNAYKNRCKPTDLEIFDTESINKLNEKDKKLAKLEDEYMATLKNVDMLSKALLKQVAENKSLKKRVKK